MAPPPAPTIPDVKATPVSTGAPSLRWIKADLHLHTAEDPFDVIDYSAGELLAHASRLGFDVLAVTLHDKVFDDPAIFAQAEALGILLVPAAELRIEGADVVLLNLSAEDAAQTHTFEDLRRLRARRGKSLLVFAPHPFYRMGGSIGRRIEDHLDCFDAVEHCHFHVPIFNPNIPARRLAARHGLPLLATSDAHRLRFFGENYSLLELAGGATPSIAEVFEAIRAGRIRLVSPTGGLPRFVSLMFFLFCIHPLLKRLPANKKPKYTPRVPIAEVPNVHPGRGALV